MASAAPAAGKPRRAAPAALAAHLDVATLPCANPMLLAIGTMTASLIQILDTTIANVAIPHMQASLGATSDEISWVLTSYIVAVALAMPLTGWLADRFGSRRLFMASVAGFCIAGWSLWQMAGWSLETDYNRIALAGFTQGIGIGLVFIPLNASAFATLTSALRTDGASLLNLMRSIGSSIGISVVTTLLGRNLQVSHSDLVSHVTSSASTMLDISTLDRFQSVGDAALQMIDGEVNRQAAMIAYLDDYTMMMWLTFLTVPFIALMRRADLSTAGRLASAQREGEQEAPPVDLPH